MRDLAERARGLAGDLDEIIVDVARPVGRIERAFGLRRRRHEAVGGSEARPDRQRRSGCDRNEATHDMTAAELRGEDAGHGRLLGWWLSFVLRYGQRVARSDPSFSGGDDIAARAAL